MEPVLLWCISVLCIVIGMIGTVMPAMPGAFLIFIGLWLAAWIEHYAYVGWRTLLALGVLTALTYCVDFLSTMIGAKRFGASKEAIMGSVVGTFIGFFIGLPGIVVGSFVGALVGELYVRGDLRRAMNSGIGATLGLVCGAAIKLALIMSMLGVFLIVRFVGT